MAFSRNAREYLERKGFLAPSPQPGPRLNLDDLLVHTLPVGRPLPGQGPLLDWEGQTPPDRGSARPWPNQTSNDAET